MIQFVSESGKTNDEPALYASYTFNGIDVSIDRAIAGVDPTIITDDVGHAVFIALGMSAAKYGIYAASKVDAQAVNGIKVRDLNPSELRKVYTYQLAQSGLVNAAGEIEIP